MADPLTESQQLAWRSFVESSWALHTHLEDELRAQTGLSMNDYHVMVTLSEAPEHRLRMGELASRLVFSPSRITYQISSMVKRGLVRKQPCHEDGRATNARLIEAGWDVVVAAAPGHVSTVRRHVLDPLTRKQLDQLRDIGDALLTTLDPDGRMTALYDPDRNKVDP
jgi:DNA-binding MarR family transcriptional regulator